MGWDLRFAFPAPHSQPRGVGAGVAWFVGDISWGEIGDNNFFKRIEARGEVDVGVVPLF